MTNHHPTDPAALSRWLRTPRRDPDPVRDACSIEAPTRSAINGEQIAGVLLAVAIGVLLAIAMVYGWDM